MPLDVTCPDGHIFHIEAGHDGRVVYCPRCKVGVRLVLAGPQANAWEVEEVAEAEVVDEGDEGPGAFRQRVRRNRARQRKKKVARLAALDRVNLGLGFHYAGMVAFLLAQWAWWIALLLLLFRLNPLLGAAPAVEDGFLLASMGLTVLAGLIDFPCPVLCLFVPESKARGLLAASLGLRGLMFLGGLGFVFLTGHWPLLLLIMFAAAAGAWVFWMLFLARTATLLEEPVLAKEAIAVLGKAFQTALMVLTCLFLFFLFVSLAIKLGRMGRFFLGGVAIAALMGYLRVVARTSAFESIWRTFFFPTGLPFFMTYLDLLGTLRTVIARRA
jgi:hypothetical protein